MKLCLRNFFNAAALGTLAGFASAAFAADGGGAIVSKLPRATFATAAEAGQGCLAPVAAEMRAQVALSDARAAVRAIPTAGRALLFDRLAYGALEYVIDVKNEGPIAILTRAKSSSEAQLEKRWGGLLTEDVREKDRKWIKHYGPDILNPLSGVPLLATRLAWGKPFRWTPYDALLDGVDRTLLQRADRPPRVLRGSVRFLAGSALAFALWEAVYTESREEEKRKLEERLNGALNGLNYRYAAIADDYKSGKITREEAKIVILAHQKALETFDETMNAFAEKNVPMNSPQVLDALLKDPNIAPRVAPLFSRLAESENLSPEQVQAYLNQATFRLYRFKELEEASPGNLYEQMREVDLRVSKKEDEILRYKPR